MAVITLPGLIDIHVHLRDPGQIHKEDFYTGTSAALAGGFTTVIDMPNNATPITTEDLLQQKMDSAAPKTVCDIGFYLGSLGDNVYEYENVKQKVFGIKLYLNPTTGNYLIDPVILDTVYKNWTSKQPILVHAEADVIGQVMQAVRTYKKPTHVCHVSSELELSP
ncbi:MAG TPA: amidohydrolase family protein, partial [Candidatus Nitrosocosmicus sp.]|nr:amidohydrolase family protein [Candidatus Nitrosocosmicus sp.]